MVRLVPLLAATAALSLVGGCRADTIRTSDDHSTTTVGSAPDSSAKPGGPSASGKRGTSSSAGGGTSSTAGTTGKDATSGSAVTLSGSSLGPTSIGTGADQAVAAMRKVLGAPSRDLKQPGASCPGPDRLVSWGRFSMYFARGKLAGWGYDSTPAGPPQLSTPSGITVGSTVATLRRVYGDKVKIHGAEDPFPAGFSVAVSGGDLTGTLTGTADADTTTSMAYGVSCGE